MKTFDQIDSFREQIHRVKDSENEPIILVANKVDLPRREVDQKLAEGYAKTRNMLYIETSAKTRQGVHSKKSLVDFTQNGLLYHSESGFGVI